MGEHTDEAIMPLVKTRGGALGVRAQGGGGGDLHFHSNVYAPGSTMPREEYRQIAQYEAERAMQARSGMNTRDQSFRGLV